MKKLFMAAVLFLSLWIFPMPAHAQSIDLSITFTNHHTPPTYYHNRIPYVVENCVWNRQGYWDCHYHYEYAYSPPRRAIYTHRAYQSRYYSPYRPSPESVCLKWKLDQFGGYYCAHSVIK